MSDFAPEPSALATLRRTSYDWTASDLVRFHDDSVDDTVANAVHDLVNLPAAERSAALSQLNDDDVEALRLFAFRRTVHARRTASMMAAYEALDTYALFPSIRDLAWNQRVKALLLVARSIGLDVPASMDRFRTIAGEEGVKRFEVVVDALARITTMEECGVAEVTTLYGIGLLELLIFRDLSPRTITMSPRAGDHRIGFHPRRNVAQLTARIADDLDAAGLTTGPLRHDQLSGTLCGRIVPGSYLPTTGCLSFSAFDQNNEGTIVFCGELTDEGGAEALATDASRVEGQRAWWNGPLLVIASRQPTDADDPDTPTWAAYDEIVPRALSTAVAELGGRLPEAH